GLCLSSAGSEDVNENLVTELVGEAHGLGGINQFRELAIHQLARALPCDLTSFATLGMGFHNEVAPFLLPLFLHPEHYYEPGQIRARAIRDPFDYAFIDVVEFTPQERDRLPFFRELLQPNGVTSSIHTITHFAGRASGFIHLFRSGRGHPFREDELAA